MKVIIKAESEYTHARSQLPMSSEYEYNTANRNKGYSKSQQNSKWKLIDRLYSNLSNNTDQDTTKYTKKRALEDRMSHSTVCNNTVSTKKTRPKLVK